MGRMANALTTARELKEEGDEVKVIFDGAGTKWAAELAEGHKYSELLDQVRDKVEGRAPTARTPTRSRTRSRPPASI